MPTLLNRKDIKTKTKLQTKVKVTDGKINYRKKQNNNVRWDNRNCTNL